MNWLQKLSEDSYYDELASMSQQEQDDHPYRDTLKELILGGVAGGAVGSVGRATLLGSLLGVGTAGANILINGFNNE